MSVPNKANINFVHVLVAATLLTLLGLMGWAALTGYVKRIGCQQISILSNMKQLHLATAQMALDGLATTNAQLGWPGDTGGSFAHWAETLVTENYLSTNNLCQLLFAPGHLTTPDVVPLSNTNGVLVYAVSETSPGRAVFLSSANFTNTPTGGSAPLPTAQPFGAKGFVLVSKDGDGAVLQNYQAGNTNLIGPYAPLCK